MRKTLQDHVMEGLHAQKILKERLDLAERELSELRAELSNCTNDIKRIGDIEPSCAAWVNLQRLCEGHWKSSTII
eukprot:SAG31_NODE_10487_length_1132_cov_1.775411_1_plen_75_part_00